VPSRFYRALVLLSAAVVASHLACGRAGESPPPAADPSSRRVIQQGAVVGFASVEGAHVWRGIPFARPPLGDLRWRAPEPPEPWTGTLEALSFGSSCVQFAGPRAATEGKAAGEPTGSEDCLYLNVYAPHFEPDAVPRGEKRLPVMLWIHGGGNTIGDARIYDAGRLALGHRLIVVTVQYRLGVFGWFAHRALCGEGTTVDDRSGNYGTLDLVRALRWVRESISAFGGDPERVTVFGESAGGRNTFSMLLTPRARGLFHRAIVQSGAIRTSPMARAEHFVDTPEPGDPWSSGEVLLKLLIRDGEAKDRESGRARLAAMSDARVAGYLRGKSAYEVLSVYEGNRLGGMYSIPQMPRDGNVLPEEKAIEALARPGGYNRVPVILGSNRDESKLFLAFGSPYVTRLFGIPLWVNDERAYDLVAEYAALMWKATGVDEPAAAMRSLQGPSVYAYRFDWDEEPKLLWSDFSKLFGAAHALEIPFVFGHFDLGWASRFLFDEEKRAGYEDLSKSMMSYWAEFAYSGDPGRGRDGAELHWAAWDDSGEGAAKFIVFDSEEGGGLRMAAETVTQEEVIERVATDPRFESWRERCEVYQGFVGRIPRMTEERYESVGEGACRAYPLDAYPWQE
jgi:para-nitrobenzyl esterase